MMEFINIADLKDPSDKHGRSYREVNNSKTHKFPIGKLIEIKHGVRLFIAKQIRDCDGSLLYCLTPFKEQYEQEKEGFANHDWINGIGEEDIKDL